MSRRGRARIRRPGAVRRGVRAIAFSWSTSSTPLRDVEAIRDELDRFYRDSPPLPTPSRRSSIGWHEWEYGLPNEVDRAPTERPAYACGLLDYVRDQASAQGFRFRLGNEVDRELPEGRDYVDGIRDLVDAGVPVAGSLTLIETDEGGLTPLLLRPPTPRS